jgi:hypothetical protein
MGSEQYIVFNFALGSRCNNAFHALKLAKRLLPDA